MSLSAIECPDGVCHSHHGGHAVPRTAMQKNLQGHGREWCERLAERIYEMSVDTFSQTVMPSLHASGWQRRHLDLGVQTVNARFRTRWGTGGRHNQCNIKLLTQQRSSSSFYSRISSRNICRSIRRQAKSNRCSQANKQWSHENDWREKRGDIESPCRGPSSWCKSGFSCTCSPWDSRRRPWWSQTSTLKQ